MEDNDAAVDDDDEGGMEGAHAQGEFGLFSFPCLHE
jgi:hypothetical protein